jgi:nucleoside-diphosphate-sugar epimerase
MLIGQSGKNSLNSMTILLTGANGFVGSALSKTFLESKINYRAALKTLGGKPLGLEKIAVGDISSRTDWKLALKDIECVVHLAARVHVMRDASLDPLSEFRRVNVEGTRNLALQAVAAGVKRFVYLSSIKVNGELTQPNSCFTADDSVNPQDPYGISKWEAEQVLHQISENTGLEVVVIRPPLIYGPNAKGNFASMVKWLGRGIPLPFGSINNLRSLVSVYNLCDLILRCVDHPVAAGQTFMVSDDEDLSTTDLLNRTAFAMGLKTSQINVPQKLLELSASLLGQSNFAQRLFGSLQVDISATKSLLNWKPPFSVDEGLKRAVSSSILDLN